MLIGNYVSKLANNGRAAIPKKFRQELGDKLIITQGYENCLVLVSQLVWEKLVDFDKPFILDAARETDRFLMGNAFELEPDAQGRIIVPGSLKDYAQLNDEIVFVGVGNRVEIWGLKRWIEYQEHLKENSNEIAKRLVESQNS